MSLTKDDLQSIKGIVSEVVITRFNNVITRFNKLDRKVDKLQLEVHDTFKKQTKQLSHAIADSVKLLSKNHDEEIQNVYERIEDLEDRTKRL